MSIYSELLAYETNPANPADGRRVISDERQVLHVCIERVQRLERAKLRSHEAEAELTEERKAAAERLRAAKAEARRVLAMWS